MMRPLQRRSGSPSNTELPRDPTIPLLGTYLRKLKSCIRTKTCVQCSERHDSYPESGITLNVHQLVNKYNVVYPDSRGSSHRKRNETLLQATTQMKPENMQREGSRSQRPHIVGFRLYQMSRRGKSMGWTEDG